MSLTKGRDGRSSLKASYLKKVGELEAAYAETKRQFCALKERLESSHQTLEQVITHMSDGLIFITFPGTITLFNAAAVMLTGYEQQQALHASYWDLFCDQLFGFSIREALHGQPVDRCIFLTLNENREIEVVTSTIPEGGILLLLRDRTEQRRLEKSLSHADRLKELGEMAATLAHEIRNPLGGIAGFAQLLKRDLEDDTQRRMIQAILEGVAHLEHLVINVLEYARPVRLHFAPTDLVALVKESIALATVSCDGGSCRFDSAYPVYSLAIDRHRIKRVLLNLLRNAFESEANHVEVHLDEEGTLTITDDGIGICEQDRSKIFTPFFTTKRAGTGIGLAECLAAVQAHNGLLEVHPGEEGGSIFTLKLVDHDRADTSR